MKNKSIVIGLIFAVLIGILNLGFNVYFLTQKFATKAPTAGGVFNACYESVVELKAETESVGTSYGTGEIINADGTIITNAHVICYKNLRD